MYLYDYIHCPKVKKPSAQISQSCHNHKSSLFLYFHNNLIEQLRVIIKAWTLTSQGLRKSFRTDYYYGTRFDSEINRYFIFARQVRCINIQLRVRPHISRKNATRLSRRAGIWLILTLLASFDGRGRFSLFFGNTSLIVNLIFITV